MADNSAEQSLSELQLLYHTSRSIAASVDVDDVIAAYLDQVARGDRYACNIVVYNYDAGEIVSRTLRGTWKPDFGLVFSREEIPYQRDLLDDDLEVGQTVRINNVETDPRVPPVLLEMQQRDGRMSLALIPLAVQDHRVGLVTLAFRDPHDWQDHELRPYEVTAAQLSLALQRRIEADRHRERGQKLALLEERNSLARELHDSVTQMLFSLHMLAQSTKHAFEKNPEEGARRVDRIVDLSERALGEMRALLGQLRGGELGKEVSLITKIQRIADDLRLHGVVVELDLQAYIRQDSVVEHGIARIVQEGASNALKHASAQLVRIGIRVDESLVIEIEDDGIGIPDQPKQGLGLSTMRERTESLNGTFTLERLSKGTKLRFTIPRQDHV